MWKPMAASDVPAAYALSLRIHPDYPEDIAVIDERFRLYPNGCFVSIGGNGMQGYCISHPWQSGSVPSLNSLVGSFPIPDGSYYIHDVALLGGARRAGEGAAILGTLKLHARHRRDQRIFLVAVNGSAPFWGRHGFTVVQNDAMREKLVSYGRDARYMVCHLHVSQP